MDTCSGNNGDTAIPATATTMGATPTRYLLKSHLTRVPLEPVTMVTAVGTERVGDD